MVVPKDGQAKHDFIAAFMADEDAIKSHPDEKQRYIEAAAAWREYINKSVYKQSGLEVQFKITKASHEGLVSGWANVALTEDGTPPLDWQDDTVRPEVLEKAAINFMLNYRGSGVMHAGESKGVIVESIVLTKEKQAAIGIPEGVVPEGWFITVKVLDDEVFSLVKAGVYRMFSIQGSATRVEL